MRGRII